MSMDTVRRAFQLADAGDCRSVSEIRRTLQKERRDSVDGHFTSGLLRSQLKARVDATRAARTRIA
jgi:hypothetical protein